MGTSTPWPGRFWTQRKVSVCQTPDRSGFPSGVFGTGPDKSGLPSGVRGDTGYVALAHCAWAAPDVANISTNTAGKFCFRIRLIVLLRKATSQPSLGNTSVLIPSLIQGAE